MDKDEKKHYKYLKQWAEENGVVAFAKEIEDDGMYNGISVAYMKAMDTPDCRMVLVSVSYCAPEDTFKKKKGKYEALAKLYNCEYVQLPLAKFLTFEGISDAYAKDFMAEIFHV